jgi:ABC-type amino acid transport substrate-binding protein
MRLYTFFLGMILFFIPGLVLANPLNSLNLYTEYYPPYNYEDEEGLKGVFIDVMEILLQKSGSSLGRNDIKLEDWSVGYNAALKTPGTVLFGCTRTAQRENLFQWVGPVADNRSVVFAKKERKVIIDAPQDIVRKGYTIGVVKDDVGQQLLLEAGVPEASMNVQSFPTICLMELYRDEIDAWSYSEGVCKWLASLYGMDTGNFESVHVLNEGKLYIVVQKDTPAVVADTLQKVLDDIRASGELQEILDRHL